MSDKAENTTTAIEKPASSVDLSVIHDMLDEVPEGIAENISQLALQMNPNKKGFEEMGGGVWRPAVIKVKQLMSSEAPEEAKNGDFYTDMGEIIPQPFKFIPLYMFESKVEFLRNGEVGKLGDPERACRSNDGKVSIYGDSCETCEFRPFAHGKPTTCNNVINAYVFDKDVKHIYQLSFMKTSLKAGRKLRMLASQSAVPWKNIFAYNTVQKENQRQGNAKYWVSDILPTAQVIDNEATLKVLEKFYDYIADSRRRLIENDREQASRANQVNDAIENAITGGTTLEASPAAAGDKEGGNFDDL